MQALDVTTLAALLQELRQTWLPARVESVRQDFPHTVRLTLRRAEGIGSLEASCHPVAARLHLCSQKTSGKTINRYPFSQQLFQYLGGQLLVSIQQPAWERVAILEFAARPQAEINYRFYVEIMGKYSNLILTDQAQTILCCAHTVSDQQSRVRPLTPGDTYSPPPPLTRPMPELAESLNDWQERINLLPIPIEKALLEGYRGVSKQLARQMLQQVQILSSTQTNTLNPQQWQNLYQAWQHWLMTLAHDTYQPGLTAEGYTVLGWSITHAYPSGNRLIEDYYTQSLSEQTLQQQRHRFSQIVNTALRKVQIKRQDFETRQNKAGTADHLKQKADLLMAQEQTRTLGQSQITLPDFETTLPILIPLNPAKDLIANAQTYYRQHRKAHRALIALDPLLLQVRTEESYLEGILSQLEQADLAVLTEIEQELRTTGYVSAKNAVSGKATLSTPYYRFQTPSGLNILCGRNNRQNEEITFRVAQPQDLWFHAQEIPGAHVLLQLPSGQVPEQTDLETAAHVAAHFSRARQSGQVPVLYTPRQQVRKLKGHLPGLVTYMSFKVIWGKPDHLPQLAE